MRFLPFLVDPSKTRQMPRAPLPAQGVTSYGVLSRTTSEGVTLPSQLLCAHATDQNPPFDFAFRLFQKVFAGCRQPLLEVGPSQCYLRNSCIGAWTPTPQRPFGALSRFFPKGCDLTLQSRSSARYIIVAMQLQRRKNYEAAVIPLCSGSHTCQTPRLHPLLRTYISSGWPGLLRHAMNLWLPIMNRGIATCLNREIDTAGLSPAELRPYWLLPLCFFLWFSTIESRHYQHFVAQGA